MLATHTMSLIPSFFHPQGQVRKHQEKYGTTPSVSLTNKPNEDIQAYYWLLHINPLFIMIILSLYCKYHWLKNLSS